MRLLTHGLQWYLALIVLSALSLWYFIGAHFILRTPGGREAEMV